MTGGLLQLAVYGNQDFYLTGNPQISYFKSVYRRYTNFSMEMIEILPKEGYSSVNYSSETEVVFELSRNADLIKDIYLTFTLPDIYSNTSTKFQWIKYIGEFIKKNF